MLSTGVCYAEERKNIIEIAKDSAKEWFIKLPDGVKLGTIAIGGVAAYGIMSNPKILQNIIMHGAKSQKVYTRQQAAAFKRLVQTGKPTLVKGPKVYKETPEYLEFLKLMKGKKLTYQDKIDFLKMSRKVQRWVIEELKK
jgi:hypothetical protein